MTNLLLWNILGLEALIGLWIDGFFKLENEEVA